MYRKFQQFAQLPVTGRLDAATVDRMRQPRCGFHDLASPEHDPTRPLQYNAGKNVCVDLSKTCFLRFGEIMNI